MIKVVCNSSPIIGLCIIKKLNLLWELFNEVKSYLDTLIQEDYRISKRLYLEALKMADEEERIFEKK